MREISLKTFNDEESDFSDADNCDEYDESLEDLTEIKGRHSIANMVTMHKLNINKAILRNHKVGGFEIQLVILI